MKGKSRLPTKLCELNIIERTCPMCGVIFSTITKSKIYCIRKCTYAFLEKKRRNDDKRRERDRVRSKRRYQEAKEQMKEKRRKWEKANPDKVRAKNIRLRNKWFLEDPVRFKMQIIKHEHKRQGKELPSIEILEMMAAQRALNTMIKREIRKCNSENINNEQ